MKIGRVSSRNHLVKLLCTKQMLHQHCAEKITGERICLLLSFLAQVLETIFRMSKPNGGHSFTLLGFSTTSGNSCFFTVFLLDHFSAPGHASPGNTEVCKGFVSAKSHGATGAKRPRCFFGTRTAGKFNSRRTKMAHILQGSTNIRKCEQSNMLN